MTVAREEEAGTHWAQWGFGGEGDGGVRIPYESRIESMVLVEGRWEVVVVVVLTGREVGGGGEETVGVGGTISTAGPP